MDKQELEERAAESGMLKMDGFDSCIAGIVSRCGNPDILCYDVAKVIKQLCEYMTEEEAVEFFEFNQLGAYMGEKTPCYIVYERE